MEETVVEALHAGGDEAIRLYVVACAERMAPLFIGLRTGETGREADLDFYVESVGGLWNADRPLPDAAARARRLEQFPELQPAEEEVTGVVGTYTLFAALALRYALLANASGNIDHAVSCGHVALTAMGMLDQNVTGTAFRTEEQLLQSLSVSDPATDLWNASVTAGRERLRAALSRSASGAR